MKDFTPARSRQALLVTAALFSTGGVAVKSVHMSGVQVACARSGIAAIALALILKDARRVWNWPVMLISVAYAFTLVTFVIANKLTTSADAIFLQDTAPLYILLLSGLVLRERPKRADLWFMLPLACGMALFFAGSEKAVGTAPNPPLGNLIAAASGVTYALIVVGFRWLSRGGDTQSSAATVIWGNAIGCLFCLPFAGRVVDSRPVDWLILIYLGVIQIALAYFLMTVAMRRVPALEASLLLLLEPVLNPIWTWLVYRERPGPLALAGGFLIIGATAARTWWSAQVARTARPDDILEGRT